MPVNVGEVVSTVTPEPEQDGQPVEGAQDWQRIADMRDMLARMNRDRQRTAAEGFDD